MTTLTIVAVITIFLAAIAGIGMTLVTLPGIWLAIAVAAIWELLLGGLYTWETLAVAIGLGVTAELTEFAASAVGASRAGGTRRGAIGSIAGGLIGAVGGTVLIPIPVVGTLAGGAIGAGLGALVAERHGGRMTWRDSARVGTGAAVGRLIATILKTCFAIAVAVVLCVGAVTSL